MNDIIKQLAVESGFNVSKLGLVAEDFNIKCADGTDVDEELTKFSKLIIKHCADLALKSGRVTNKSNLAVAEAERIYYKILALAH